MTWQLAFQILGLLTAFFIRDSNSQSRVSQATIDYIASNLNITFQVVNNLLQQDNFTADIILTNTGNIDITPGNWQIYFYSFYDVEPSHLDHNPSGYVIPRYGMRFTHVNGGLYRMQPTDDFGRRLAAGRELRMRLLFGAWSVARSDVLPNWYVTADLLTPRTIRSTAGDDAEFVGAFLTSQQWKRFPGDVYNPFTPRERFRINSDVRDLGRAIHPILPTPFQITVFENETLPLATCCWTIVMSDALFQNEALFLRESFLVNGISLQGPVSMAGRNVARPRTQYIDFLFASTQDVSNLRMGPSQEAYHLAVDPQRLAIEIRSRSPVGAFYAVQSLLSLAHRGARFGDVPRAVVNDYPRFSHRGMHVDVARNFRPKEEIFKLLDAMSMYKLNKFHFHLSDDEGWRLEIPALPELTQIGGRRCHDLREESCILPQLGSGPYNNTSGSGFYTTQDYRDILDHATRRHIEVIEEFDMPGHSHAAVVAMRARYNNFMTSRNFAEAERFVLHDPGDRTLYLSVQNFNDSTVNPCIESTYTFMRVVLQELDDLHRTSNPLRRYHFGGGEVPEAFVNSSFCQRLGEDRDGIRRYFAQRLAGITAEMGVPLSAWADGLMDSAGRPFPRNGLANAMYALPWNNVADWGGANQAYKLANAGYRVILSLATHLYFDHPHEPDPEERGLYWATRYTDTRKVFGFLPDDVYANVNTMLNGTAISRQQFCSQDPDMCTPLTAPNNIVGIQGQSWGETVRTSEQFEFMVFPRMLALAERAWHKATWETENGQREGALLRDWEAFANTLGYKELRRLDGMGIRYRVPPPGVRTNGTFLWMNSAFPGLITEVNSRGTGSFVSVDRFGRSWRHDDEDTYRTRTPNGRVSRVVSNSSAVSSSSYTMFMLTVACLLLSSPSRQ